MSVLGKLLRERRVKRGLSLREVGRLVNVNHAYISRLETGGKERPSPDLLGKLCRVLRITHAEEAVLRVAAGIDEMPEWVGDLMLARCHPDPQADDDE